ncbi:MAG: methyltransferase [Lentisphaeraceae bacterium]|nr:methyltransferase [Lentisphaeraceae bacterium]
MSQNKSLQRTTPFEGCLKKMASFEWDKNSPEPFASLDYAQECELKNNAFVHFLKVNDVDIEAAPLLHSPKPRHYRTTTKRRVFCSSNGLSFGFSNEPKAGTVAESALEPEEHLNIYKFLINTFTEKSYSALSRALNWIIIRGSYERQFLILNIYKMDAKVVRKAKQLAELLQKEKLVEGAMLYFDPSQSEYYLEAERPPRDLQIKHLFGPRTLGLKVNDTLMRYSPTGFSQINESMVPEMINLAKTMLNPKSQDHLLDLYCGYGLFSHTVGSVCKKVTGIELSSDAINSAREITKRLKTSQRSRFFSENITAGNIRDKFDPETQKELVVLDPPRKGCDAGVIPQIANRKPKRVLHIFCGTDEIPREIKQWQKSNYRVKTIQPIDMFAGTTSLETMVLLESK